MNNSFSIRSLYSLIAVGSAALLSCLLTADSLRADELDQCLQQKIVTADDTVTIGMLREQCRQETAGSKFMVETTPEEQEDKGKEGATAEKGVVEDRLQQERKVALQPFSILPHKPNYILPLAYNGQGYSNTYYTDSDGQSYDFDRLEAQFQLSIKSPLVIGLFDNIMDVYAGYTNHSFWQVFNDDISSPFRETNHEPEMWVQFHPNWDILGFKNTWNIIGINHQSNGQSGELSRSWNRIYGSVVLERGDFAFTVTPWYRIPESEGNDDNPDITKYLGHYELGAMYKWEENTFSLMARNNLESDFSRGAIQFSWSFPLWGWPYLRGYVQYFNGYGESLIDYDQHVNRLGVGLSLSDWF